jgi:hypothetical protein
MIDSDMGYCRSDFVYMVPPFLAYYGALSGNVTLLVEAYNQIRCGLSLFLSKCRLRESQPPYRDI